MNLQQVQLKRTMDVPETNFLKYIYQQQLKQNSIHKSD